MAEKKLLITTLPILDLNHPGAHDVTYRKRREEITAAAITFHQQDSASRQIPLVDYTEEENKVWQQVVQKLKPLHEQWACSWYQEGWKKIRISQEVIPQIRELSAQLQTLNGFRLEPIHGLVQPREFLLKLAQNIMLCTQYIRHSSNPEFTPEPDIIHEVLGHVPLFTHPELNQFQRHIGIAAAFATDQELTSLNRLYWYTIEYGLILEHGEIKAFGAGLLGGIKDLTNAFSGKALIRPFSMQEVVAADYNYSFEQPRFFVIPSLEFLQQETRRLILGFTARERIKQELISSP
ncbi:phenylalanine 4-monooxygenase [Candidatus Woesearchaeota archaeon]|nr:phenylalanine 4-monooxygenase [Candidatus Woesearchaeota archaeon]